MTDSNEGFVKYLQPTTFIDSDNKNIVKYAKKVTNNIENKTEKAIKLFYAVRDDIFYDPYSLELTPETMKASYTLSVKKGWCITKAILLAAVCRVVGIPSRLGFADVQNHITTEKLRRAMETETYFYHGYTEIFLNKRWIKVTPAFNLSLCEKFHIKPLEFDGENDSQFHEYDAKGNKHMEYIQDYGEYADLPFDQIMEIFRKRHPTLMEKLPKIEGSFEEDARPL